MPHSRPAEKRGGAWVSEVVNQSRLFAAPGSHVRLPVAHVVCNQASPIGDKPSLMTFREVGRWGTNHCTTAPCCSTLLYPIPCCTHVLGPQVETLFHEFGHAMQLMMTTVEEGLVSGFR